MRCNRIWLTAGVRLSWLLLLSLVLGCSPKPNNKHEVIVLKAIDDMIFVQGGSFMMGDGSFKKDDATGQTTDEYWTYGPIFESNRPAHKVTLDSYYLSKFEVASQDYMAYFKTKTEVRPQDQEFLNRIFMEDGFALVLPSWYEAKNYCTWLGTLSGLPFDLPTEAQWEFAARNRGKNVLFPTDNGKFEKGRNVVVENKEEYTFFTPLGLAPPSPLGFYNMADNVNEWVEDWHDPLYYTHSPELNPKGPAESPFKNHKWKSVRGCSNAGGGFERCFYSFIRLEGIIDTHEQDTGTRCALQLKDQVSQRELKRRALDFMRQKKP